MEISNTKLTTVRIPIALYSVIQEDAETEGIGFNTVLTRILRKYVEWDRAAAKLGMMSVTREAMKSLMEAMGELRIDEIATEEAPPVMKELSEFWFMSSSVDSQVQLLERFCKYGGLGTYNIERSETETKFHLRHGMGENFSRLVAGILGSIFENVDSQIEVADNSFSVVISPKAKPKR